MPSNTNLSLIGRAARALTRWGKSGFKTVDAATVERRENACLACPHLQAPEAEVQKVMVFISQTEKIGQRTGRKVCGVCGCFAAKKIQLVTEACPATDPDKPGLTRWGEPVQ